MTRDRDPDEPSSFEPNRKRSTSRSGSTRPRFHSRSRSACPSGKVCYGSRALAKRARSGGTHFSAYLCEECGNWHLRTAGRSAKEKSLRKRSVRTLEQAEEAGLCRACGFRKSTRESPRSKPDEIFYAELVAFTGERLRLVSSLDLCEPCRASGRGR